MAFATPWYRHHVCHDARVDDTTVGIYTDRTDRWVARRRALDPASARALRRAVRSGPVADLGCGPGFHVDDLGPAPVTLDAAEPMVDRAVARGGRGVVGDLEHLPFRDGALGGAWASRSYVHVPRDRLPLALRDLHRAMAPDAPVAITMIPGDHDGPGLPDDDFPGRWFALWPDEDLHDVVTGAGFDAVAIERTDAERPGSGRLLVTARRARRLPDTVGPGLRLLVCGLNPSEYSADAGVAYARPGNRFWPAALRAGVVTRDRDPVHALTEHGVGFTDLVARATPAISDLEQGEFAAGVARVERLVARASPRVICFVGLAGYREAVDRRAVAGVQARPFAGAIAYVMPSTSGLNASSQVPDLAAHLAAAAALAR
ncbi:MAG: uracil-DNA glycosylase family protein [Actinomycetes bacterium]